MSTWVPESERDTRWWLWHKLWKCRVPAFESRSVDHIRIFGVATSGDPTYDRSMRDEQVVRMLSINTMLEDFFKRGIPVSVVNYSDTKLIYERISDHLNAWKDKLENGWHTRNAPISDLIELDKFANVVYQHARYQFTTEIVDSIVARRMSSTLRVSRDKIMGGGPKPQVINKLDDPVSTKEEEEDSKLPKRQSMAELFAAQAVIATGGHKWK